MAKKQNSKYNVALDAINELFSDTDVSQEDTKRSLEALKDEIEILIDTLP